MYPPLFPENTPSANGTEVVIHLATPLLSGVIELLNPDISTTEFTSSRREWLGHVRVVFRPLGFDN